MLILFAIAATESGASRFRQAHQVLLLDELARFSARTKCLISRPKKLPANQLKNLSSSLPLTKVLIWRLRSPKHSLRLCSQPKRHKPNRDADWIAEVSHELRLPIANLKLLIETLLDGGALEDENTARRMLSRAQTEVDRLQHLVVNLLSVEQTASSREITKLWVPLEARAAYAIETTKKQAAEKKIQV